MSRPYLRMPDRMFCLPMIICRLYYYLVHLSVRSMHTLVRYSLSSIGRLAQAIYAQQIVLCSQISATVRNTQV